MAKEIEVKMQLDDALQKTFDAWLEKEASFIQEYQQTDHYLDHVKNSFLFDSGHGYKDYSTLLRIRFTDQGEVFVCTKVRQFNHDTLRIVDCDEHEIRVDDGETAETLFRSLGYEVRWVIQKTRKIYRYHDFEIALDKVDGLGLFIEIELKNHDNRTHRGLARIFDLLKQMGIAKFKKLRRGYLTMYLNPGYDFTEWMEL